MEPVPEPEDVPWTQLHPLRRAADIVLAVACLVLAAWFVWDIVDRDSIPTAFNVVSAVAAAMVVVEVSWRLWRSRSG
jgi:hypothetical protein